MLSRIINWLLVLLGLIVCGILTCSMLMGLKGKYNADEGKLNFDLIMKLYHYANRINDVLYAFAILLAALLIILFVIKWIRG